mmetsp:Transcript_32526/g.93626  ORF Transcript_32526/g.93626 Transcript_32526/m.93626 type:complete len:203 (-) Transcript_32526:1657-2265(-)
MVEGLLSVEARLRRVRTPAREVSSGALPGQEAGLRVRRLGIDEVVHDVGDALLHRLAALVHVQAGRELRHGYEDAGADQHDQEARPPADRAVSAQQAEGPDGEAGVGDHGAHDQRLEDLHPGLQARGGYGKRPAQQVEDLHPVHTQLHEKSEGAYEGRCREGHGEECCIPEQDEDLQIVVKAAIHFSIAKCLAIQAQLYLAC